MTSFTRLYIECADTYTLHIISDGRHYNMITAVSNVRVSLTDHRCFVHFISVDSVSTNCTISN